MLVRRQGKQRRQSEEATGKLPVRETKKEGKERMMMMMMMKEKEKEKKKRRRRRRRSGDLAVPLCFDPKQSSLHRLSRKQSATAHTLLAPPYLRCTAAR